MSYELIFITLLGGFGIWGLVANEIVYRQRLKIIKAVFASVDYAHYRNLYLAISYHKHFMRVLFFRSHKTLYSKELVDFLESYSRKQEVLS